MKWRDVLWLAAGLAVVAFYACTAPYADTIVVVQSPATAGVSAYWTTGYEETSSDCSAEYGDPNMTVSANGTPLCDYTGDDAPLDGSHSAQLQGSGDQIDWTGMDAFNEFWLRFKFQKRGAEGFATMFYIHNGSCDSSGFRVDERADGIRMHCASANSSTNTSVDPNTTYIGQWHVVRSSGVGTLDVYTNAATPAQVGSQIGGVGDCDGTDNYGSSFGGLCVRGGNTEHVSDCLELYTSNPGTPSTNACNLN